MTVAARAANTQRNRARRLASNLMLALTGLAAVVAVAPLVWILVYVVREGGRFLTPDFFTSMPTPVGVAGGGVANAIVGSAILVGLACLLAIPPGILAAIYAARRPDSPLGLAVRFGTDVLSGVPSIVVGIFAYTVIVLPQRHFSALAGGAALAIIMLPIIVRSTEEMLRLVPRDLREASLALGAPEWKTAMQVMLPAALDGVITGVMLGVARVAGEAAPLMLTSFGNSFLSTSINEPIAALPQTIFIYAVTPYKDWQGKAWTTALVLILLVLALNVAARLLMAWRKRRLGGG